MPLISIRLGLTEERLPLAAGESSFQSYKDATSSNSKNHPFGGGFGEGYLLR